VPALVVSESRRESRVTAAHWVGAAVSIAKAGDNGVAITYSHTDRRR
jgi:hypothetical protein